VSVGVDERGAAFSMAGEDKAGRAAPNVLDPILYAFFTPRVRYSSRMRWPGYVGAAAATAASTLVGLAMKPHFQLVNIAMVYLLAVVIIALRFTRAPTLASSILSVAAFDYFFVPPSGTFTVDDPQYLLTFAMMLGVGLVISQLTASVRARAQAQARLALEAESERIRNALLSSISHDLRTPLAVICGASSSLAERGEHLGAEERRSLAQSIFTHSRDMSELLAKVLEMTRLESGGLSLQRDWASLNEIVGSVLRRLEERLASHMVMIDLPKDLPLVRVDSVLMEQVFGNLLENAAKHTPPHTLIRVRAHIGGETMTVSVEDFGSGLADGDLEQIFGKFERGAGRGGMGLGLAICRAIVRLHGGSIRAERLPGAGTALRFTLPIEPPPEMPAGESALLNG
jgi:K+-sensing histidine kinase KdpD